MVTLRTIRTIGAPRTFSAALLALVLLATPGAAQEQVERSFATALVRDVLTAIHHGNRTGNYTVLRDYAADDFGAENNATQLAARFTELRGSGLDMLPTLVVEPTILQAQISAGNDQMRLTGYFPTLPQHFSFDLVFLQERGRWRMLDVSVGNFDPIEAPEPTPQAEEPAAEAEESSE
ncbi:hypothetical protein [Roseovarius indicus]|uniref:Nuclear transport factor 2 family protein n=1 Tax=Roseovarius indicus TaxID=540747 RepID=A0A5P3AEE5_9RHOB|nr:hypothetical protein [Roseovarius indicus]QEW27083.1 hypothetical protein RIdsm_02892 [Roseovarius indicus]SFD54472.1 hypothetical protein SAMN04488031_101453 [Roseovarius indicus]